MTLAGRDAEVNNLQFSNKGLYLAASWKEQDICRVFSLHKQCAHTDITLSATNKINSLSFDAYGGYLAVGGSEALSLYCYRNWGVPLKVVKPFEGPVTAAKFNDSCRNLFVGGSGSALKVFSI